MAEIANIGFETGDLSQFDSTVIDGGDLSVSAGAALAGSSYGMQAVIDDTTAIYGQANIGSWPGAATSLRYRFYIDPNSLTMAEGDDFWMAIVNGQMIVRLGYSGGNFIITGVYYGDGGYLGDNSDTITDAPHYIEGLINRAATDVSADGSYQFWIDGALVATYLNADNYDSFNNINNFRLGAPSSLDAGTSGTFYLDQLIIRNDDTEIGPVPAGGDPLSTTMRLALGYGI